MTYHCYNGPIHKFYTGSTWISIPEFALEDRWQCAVTISEITVLNPDNFKPRKCLYKLTLTHLYDNMQMTYDRISKAAIDDILMHKVMIINDDRT